MKLTVFRSAQGDCLLATDDRRNHILVDGGMAESYTDHVAPYLRYLQRRRERIGLVCITHIDQDHITGVLQLLDDLVEWRVWDFQNGRNPRARKPKVVRPPEIDGIWHNAFHELLGANAGPIESMLAAMATGLRADGSSSALATADRYDGLAASERQAILVSRRIGERQLNIPLNPEFDGRLVFVSDPATTTAVGEMRLTVIGPFAEDL
ncbi:MAG: MBL fold metallo-hydrolase, partial [Planctomycetes bacterium]|nr:MBL fold metallo-hydrolase [Planctomycetota bacterium]